MAETERLFTSADQFCGESESVKTRKAYTRALVEFGQSKYGDIPDQEIFTRLDKYIQEATRQNTLDDMRGFKKYLDEKAIHKRLDNQVIATNYSVNTKLLR
ncbi:MAG: hypothetical protein ABFC78_09290, partial [Methanoregula sp.]